MAQKRRKRFDSVAGQLAMQKRINTTIEPPMELNPEERRLFDNLLHGLPSSRWQPHMLDELVLLAKTKAYADKLIERLKKEGPTVNTVQGGIKANPVVPALTSVTSSIRALSSNLGLSASQRGIKYSLIESELEAEKSARAQAKRDGGSGSLLA